VCDDRGRLGFFKPVTSPRQDHPAFREFIVSRLAQKLDLNVAEVRAVSDADKVISVRRGHLTFGLESVRVIAALSKVALDHLKEYVGILILYVMIGAADREKCWHHVYSMDDSIWYSIDYGYSFHGEVMIHDLDRPGNPNHRYAGDYPQEILNAMNEARQLIDDAIDRATMLTDSIIDLIFQQTPPHLKPKSAEVLDSYRGYLTRRIERLPDDVAEWKARKLG
jgi:hypothetical protein